MRLSRAVAAFASHVRGGRSLVRLQTVRGSRVLLVVTGDARAFAHILIGRGRSGCLSGPRRLGGVHGNRLQRLRVGRGMRHHQGRRNNGGDLEWGSLSNQHDNSAPEWYVRLVDREPTCKKRCGDCYRRKAVI